MAAFKVRLSIVQGEDFHKRFTWKTGKPPSAVDVTGCSARMHVRANIDSPDPLLTLSTADGRITLGGVEGHVDIDLTNADTAAINWVSAVYDLEIVFPSGRVRRLMKGPVVVDREVTRGP